MTQKIITKKLLYEDKNPRNDSKLDALNKFVI